MEIQRLQLDDFETDQITVGLLRLAANVPDYEFFFHLNQLNHFYFERIEDLIITGSIYIYRFPVYRGYSKSQKVCFRCIVNKSSESRQLKKITELFAAENSEKYLIPHFSDSDYIIFSTEPSPDFSLILLPENLTFAIQEYHLQAEEELYHIIQHYE